MSEFRIVIFIVAVLALVAFMARQWTANAAAVGAQTQVAAPAEPPQARLRHAQVRSMTGASLRVASGF